MTRMIARQVIQQDARPRAAGDEGVNRSDAMQSRFLYKSAGTVFVLASLLMITCFTLLGALLGFPDILRAETGVVFQRLLESGASARILYYGLMLSAVLLIFEAVLFHKVFDDGKGGVLLSLGKYCGICAGMFFIFGFMRWVFLVPYLVETYTSADPGGAAAATAEGLFRAFDIYLGLSMGEHMGFLFLSLMLGFFGITIIRSSLAPAWLGWCAMGIGLGVLYGNTEVFGFPLAFDVNRVATKLSLAWMVTLGIILLLKKTPATEVSLP